MQDSHISIRPLSEIDAQPYREIRLRAIVDAPSTMWPTAEEELAWPVAQTEALLHATVHEIVFGAFAGEHLIGVTSLHREPVRQAEHTGFVWGVFVDQAYRRQGTARKLFAAVVAQAKATGVIQLHLSVNTENFAASNFYRSLGFESFGIKPRVLWVGGRFYDEEQMVLRLDD
ncbi:GNAT family N-acetyltransferase [Pseudomonas sp. MWU13-2100]|uniref:GNAT family N-acetyltransferase n=1 Tax=Pseudomonas sp. MWU13-2100 TaxID=2935075 RepID=UPI00200BC151|nr:GNAT family N-acetyltransferase [Pseudomonas sp. MWU13-2100]